ncbi:MAG: Cof-type HAD-IIB family hydrolase [Clostridia bacterium]|nr:Cof-type HAD-IIB family hydrolase [Clostridia bacterium]
MLKLIASDLDGTLLPPHKGLPEETFPLVEKLYKKGIIFAPASGRQLPNLKKTFAPVLDKIAIIAENGGIVWFNGDIIYSRPTPAEDVARTLKAVKKVEGLYPLLSCADCAYYDADNAQFIETVKRSYTSTKKVASLDKICGEVSVIKISVWDEQPPCANHGAPALAPLLGGLRTIASGYDWLDVSAEGSNKGVALTRLMQELGVKKEECEAYGDHMNDFEMLEACGRPFVTANAFAGLKKYFPNELLSNADLGVIKRLKEILK